MQRNILLDYQFSMKGYNRNSQLDQMQRAQYGERVPRFHVLSKDNSLPSLHVLNNTEALQIPWGFLWRLHYIGWFPWRLRW